MGNKDETCTYEETKSVNGIPMFVCSKCGNTAFWVKPIEGVCSICSRIIVKEEKD